MTTLDEVTGTRSVRRRGRAPLTTCALLLALALVITAGVTLGSVTIPVDETWRALTGRVTDDPRWQVVLMQLRLPRILTAALAGSALGLAGLQMQTMFRNALADPYILGVASGASLGVATVVLIGAGTGAGFVVQLAGWGRAGLVVAAALGAAAVLGVIMLLARWVRSPITLLLLGVMLASGTGALVSIMVARADPRAVQQYLLWGMGSFSNTSWADLRLFAGLAVAGALLALVNIRTLNALLLGEGYARSMGVNLRHARGRILISTALLAGVTTAFCGPVGFIGLAIPHLARVAFGTADHRVLVPGVCLMGSVVAVSCAIISQLPGTNTTLPLNAVTALLGAPVVIAVLVRSRRQAFAGMS